MWACLLGVRVCVGLLVGSEGVWACLLGVRVCVGLLVGSEGVWACLLGVRVCVGLLVGSEGVWACLLGVRVCATCVAASGPVTWCAFIRETSRGSTRRLTRTPHTPATDKLQWTFPAATSTMTSSPPPLPTTS